MKKSPGIKPVDNLVYKQKFKSNIGLVFYIYNISIPIQVNNHMIHAHEFPYIKSRCIYQQHALKPKVDNNYRDLIKMSLYNSNLSTKPYRFSLKIINPK